jgi:5'-3' exonuclease
MILISIYDIKKTNMGIKHYFYWFSKNHKDCIQTVQNNRTLPECKVEIDTLGLDLNGIFHPCAQKVFKYGAHAPKVLHLLGRRKTKSMKKLRLECFQEVCNTIESLVNIVKPKKRLLLCIDGVAGTSKCCQQRQRRFKSAKERCENEEKSGIKNEFDSCSITPGTKFMHYLSKYIDWYIRQKINSGEWEHLDVVFSSEKVPGEGEHKIISLFKDYCDPTERMMIYGLDADLIMLCLSTGLPNIYVYRDNIYNSKERFVINIGQFSNKLKKELQTPSAVTDFVFMCFMVGNDFLPQIPGLEILNNGIEMLLKLYKEECRPFGLINTSDYTIRMNTFTMFCYKLSSLELDAIKEKYKIRYKYHEDELLEEYFSYDEGKDHHFKDGTTEAVVKCDFREYKKEYYRRKLDINTEPELQTLCSEYIKGLHWVIQYYCKGIPSWTWYFPYNYGPFMDDLYRCTSYKYTPFIQTKPLEPFEQLLAVIPPQSNKLLPPTLRKLMSSELSPMIKYYPKQFKIDLSGKRAEWEGIAVLPIMDFRLLRDTYSQVSKTISQNDMIFNKKHNTIHYTLSDKSTTWKSFYGDIEDCRVVHKILL